MDVHVIADGRKVVIGDTTFVRPNPDSNVLVIDGEILLNVARLIAVAAGDDGAGLVALEGIDDYIEIAAGPSALVLALDLLNYL